jgi:hypothetical protein
MVQPDLVSFLESCRLREVIIAGLHAFIIQLQMLMSIIQPFYKVGHGLLRVRGGSRCNSLLNTTLVGIVPVVLSVDVP